MVEWNLKQQKEDMKGKAEKEKTKKEKKEETGA